eukprot:jgi/Botrbrau1/208/Bobra.0022s0188.1
MWFLSRDVPGFCATVAKELGIKASEELSFYTPSGEFLETEGLVRAFIRADNENSMANLSKWGICKDEDSVILSVSSKAAEPGATKVRPPKKRFEVWQPDCGTRVITYGLRTDDGKLIGRLASKSLGEQVESQVEIAFNWIENSIYKKYKNVVMEDVDCQYETPEAFKSSIRKFINHRVNNINTSPSKAEKAARFAWIHNKPPAAELRKAFESNDISNFFHENNREVESKTAQADNMSSGKKADTNEVRLSKMSSSQNPTYSGAFVKEGGAKFFGKRVDESKNNVVSEEESTEDDSDTEVEELKEASSPPPKRSLRSPAGKAAGSVYSKPNHGKNINKEHSKETEGPARHSKRQRRSANEVVGRE